MEFIALLCIRYYLGYCVTVKSNFYFRVSDPILVGYDFWVPSGYKMSLKYVTNVLLFNIQSKEKILFLLLFCVVMIMGIITKEYKTQMWPILQRDIEMVLHWRKPFLCNQCLKFETKF